MAKTVIIIPWWEEMSLFLVQHCCTFSSWDQCHQGSSLTGFLSLVLESKCSLDWLRYWQPLAHFLRLAFLAGKLGLLFPSWSCWAYALYHTDSLLLKSIFPALSPELSINYTRYSLKPPSCPLFTHPSLYLSFFSLFPHHFVLVTEPSFRSSSIKSSQMCFSRFHSCHRKGPKLEASLSSWTAVLCCSL